MPMKIKACLYCHKKKIKCSRTREIESCKKCVSLNLTCVNREQKDFTVVSVDSIKHKQEEIDTLKRKVEELEEEKRILKEASQSINSEADSIVPIDQPTLYAILACVKCSSSSFKFCNYLHEYIDGSVTKVCDFSVQFEDFDRGLQDINIELPSKNEALELLKTAHGYLCNNYYLLVLSDTLEFIDRVYSSVDLNCVERVELARLFFLFALGEIYSYPHKTLSGGPIGVRYLKIGLSLIRDTYESPSMEQIEVLLLATLFFNATSLLNYAYVYIGICSRLAIILGMNNMNNKSQRGERGNRIWCSIYTIEVSLCSSLGYRISISNMFPCISDPGPEFDHDLGETYFITKRLALAKINEKIIDRIYSFERTDDQIFITINDIINELNDFYIAFMADWKYIEVDARGAYKRSYMTLQLRFNECIILVTRPILFSTFVTHGSDRWKGEREWSVSSHALKFSEICIHAAMSNVSMINEMFMTVNFPKYGYYEVNFLFSSSIVIVLSSSLDYFSNVVDQETRKDLTTFSEMAISTMQRIADLGNPAAKGLLGSLSQLREKLSKQGGYNNSLLIPKSNSAVYSQTLQKILEEYIPGEFEFDFGGPEINY